MDPQLVEILVRAGVELGVEVALAIMRAVQAGDVSTVQQLAKGLPDAHALALADAALVASQRAKAGA